jgi:hypothetical protein
MVALKTCTLVVLAVAAFISILLSFIAALIYYHYQWQCQEGFFLIHFDHVIHCIDRRLLYYNGTCDGEWKVERAPEFVRVKDDAPPYLFGIAVGVMVSALAYAHKTDESFRATVAYW